MAPEQELKRVPMYTASEVEARTGVPATTLRQWERRYDFPRPARNASGYRLYSPQDLLEIGWMQAHLRRGVAARRAAELARAGQTDPEPASGSAPDPQALSARLTGALLDSDPQSAAAVMDEAAAQMTPEELLLSIISPSLVEIGRRWAAGEITVAHEHQASAFLRSRLSSMMDSAEVWAGRGPLVVVAGAPGDQHELGLMMITLALRRRGVRVAYIGSDSPLGDLAAYVRSCGAQGLALGLQGEWALGPTRAGRPALDGLAVDGQAVPIFFGGALLNRRPELAEELGGLYTGPDAIGAADTIIRELLARSRRHAAQLGAADTSPHPDISRGHSTAQEEPT